MAHPEVVDVVVLSVDVAVSAAVEEPVNTVEDVAVATAEVAVSAVDIVAVIAVSTAVDAAVEASAATGQKAVCEEAHHAVDAGSVAVVAVDAADQAVSTSNRTGTAEPKSQPKTTSNAWQPIYLSCDCLQNFQPTSKHLSDE